MEEKGSVFEQYQEKYFDFAAEGDVEKVTGCLKVLTNKDLKNEKGWTALMFAARNGHSPVVRLLLEKGCDAYAINHSGQTALEIAQFWNQKEIIGILTPSTDTSQQVAPQLLPSLPTIQKANYFGHNILDRAAHRRKDAEWLEEKLKNRKTKFLLFSDMQVVVLPLPDNTLGRKTEHLRLLEVYCDDIPDLLAEEHITIFLGIEPARGHSSVDPFDSDSEGPAWFALNFGSLSDDRVYKIHPHATILGPFPAFMQLVDKDAGILAQARSVLAWHDRYQFCPTCGSTTSIEEAGYKRNCTKEDCRSRQGVHNTCYPRVDPTVIMAVTSPDTKQILLGRGKRFPRSMWTCLAGFMEPGETIEDACRREVLEEAGIKVGHVEYHSCQPWPMPSSLMIGCLGYATSTEIKVDPEELEDAKWFSRQDAVQMLTHQHPKGLFCPPEQALAHQLIRAWVARTSNL